MLDVLEVLDAEEDGLPPAVAVAGVVKGSDDSTMAAPMKEAITVIRTLFFTGLLFFTIVLLFVF